jgi:hypothetical protein
MDIAFGGIMGKALKRPGDLSLSLTPALALFGTHRRDRRGESAEPLETVPQDTADWHGHLR